MKKSLFSFCVMLMTFSSFAQITITDADYPVLNDTIIFGADTNATINVSGKGLQNWDFSMLNNDAIDTLVFIDPAITTFASNFSLTDIAIEDDNQTLYYSKTNLVFENNGFSGDPLGINAEQAYPFDNAQTLMVFPATYTSLMSDTSSAEIKMNAKPYTSNTVDSVWIKHTVYSYSEIDGYGNLTLPNGKTYNTLKQSSTAITIDSVWIYVTNTFVASGLGVTANQWAFSPAVNGVIDENPILDTVYTHNWIANGKKYPLIETTVDTLEGTPLLTKFRIGGVVGATISTTNIRCNGMSDGELTVSPTVGFSPYTYEWNNGATVNTLTGLGAGNYTVTVTDMFGDTVSTGVELINPAPVSANLNITDVLCYGESNGTVEILNVAGNTPYSFLWSTGATTETLIGLVSDTLSLSITANGCEGIVDSIFINQFDKMTSIIYDALTPLGGISSPYIIVQGGITPYSYVWSNGSTIDTFQVDMTCDFTYMEVTVTDMNGCNLYNSEYRVCESVEELETKLNIYPNPTTGSLRVDLLENSTNNTITIFDALGKQIITQKFNASTSIDLSSHRKGMYYISIATEKGIITRKITLTQ